MYTIYLDRHIDGINALTHTKQTRTHNLDAVCVTMICGDEYCHKEVAESSLAGERERKTFVECWSAFDDVSEGVVR